MQYPGFIHGANESQAFSADQQRTINWYVETTQAPGAPARAALLPTPGVKLLADTNTKFSKQAVSVAEFPGRAHFFESDREFAVIGGGFYEIDAVGALTSRGTVAYDGNPATIGTQGLIGGFSVTNFTINRALEEAMMVDITFTVREDDAGAGPTWYTAS